MAHAIVGIDLGASAVKFVVLEAGLRRTRVLSAFAEPVPAGDAALAERQAKALRAGLGRLPGEATAYLAMGGEALVMRVLDLPFADARKIEQVVGYELEGQMVHALEDVVVDHVVLGPRAGGSSALAVAARTADVQALLEAAHGAGAEPRSLYAAPAVYQALFAAHLPAAGEDAAIEVLIDVGHQRTNVCFLLGPQALWGRTLTRGGFALTEAVAQAFRCDLAQAEQAKRQHGRLAVGGRTPVGAAQERMSATLREALEPLLRDLRQTLASFRAQDRRPLGSVLLTGGGAALDGLGDLLESEIGLPVTPYAPDLGDALADDVGAAEAARFTLAAAVARAGAQGRRQIDLRRGPLQARARFSALRQKAAHLAVLAVAVVAAAVVDGAMAMGRLNRERDRLEVQLRTATQELFGEPRLDAQAVTLLLKKGFREEMAPIPKATAFDLLDEISRRVPAADKVKLDLLELDIKPKKTFIKGTVDSAAAVDEMVARLREIDCFEDIAKGPITEVSAGGKSFTLTIASRCP